MQTELVIEVQSIPEAIGLINGWLERAHKPDLRGTFRYASEKLLQRTEQNFQHSEGPDGEAWVPLKYRSNPPPTLILTGFMERMAYEGIKAAQITDNAMLVDIPKPIYNIFHLTGTSRMPARPWIGWNDRIIDYIAEEAAEDVIEFILSGKTKSISQPTSSTNIQENH